MRAPLTIGTLTLRFLTLRDWCDLTREWLGERQQAHEQALRRSGAPALEIAQAVQQYAERQSAYALLLEMCKTYDGALMILERAGRNSGVAADQVHAALEGMNPDDVAILAMRACGWEIKATEPGNG
jgi:thiamine monophosphate synthase